MNLTLNLHLGRLLKTTNSTGTGVFYELMMLTCNVLMDCRFCLLSDFVGYGNAEFVLLLTAALMDLAVHTLLFLHIIIATCLHCFPLVHSALELSPSCITISCPILIVYL